MYTFNQRKGEFISIVAAGTDGITANQIPSLTDITVALITSSPGANGVRLPEGSIGDIVEVVSVDFGGIGGEVSVYHPNGVTTFRRMPDNGGSISWMIISKL